MLEVCVDSVQAAVLACSSGAQRIELSDYLNLGGITPSDALMAEVRKAVSVPLIVLVRSRPGNFEFSDIEVERMIDQSKQAMRLGADGIAIGGLLPGGALDEGFLRSVAETLPDCELVVHRAFDSVRDPEQAIETLIELGFRRILTSGGPPLAMEGLSAIKQWNVWAGDQIEFLPAGGVQPSNAKEILTKSGCYQLHGSFRSPLAVNSNGLPDPSAIERTRRILEEYLLDHR